MRTRTWITAFIPLFTCGAVSRAQTIDAAARTAVIETLLTEVGRRYVDADTAQRIVDVVRGRMRAGAYDAITDPRRLSDVLTVDLRAVNGDRHLGVSYAPPPADGSRRVVGGLPRGESARRDHWGLGRVDVLPGNVGYMKVNAFDGSPSALDATSAALKYLEGSDAMIFDFRGMGGGSGQQSNFLISHFVTADTVPSLVVANRDSKRTRYTLASVPGQRRPTVPIWILIDRGTASAGEDFSFVLQQLGRAKTVGDRTAGAGHNNATVDLGNGFSASISVTRVSDARTGKEWERVGVRPDVAVRPGDALSVAHVAALDSLARLTTDNEYLSTLATVRAGVAAQAHPHNAPPTTLARYAGAYEGERVITVVDGALVFRRDASRPPRPMITVDDSTFVLGALRIAFAPGPDGVMRMMQHFADGSTFAMRRTGDAPGELAP